MNELLQEVLDKQKEAKYLLWQALLTINGFIITIVVGMVAFGGFGSSPTLIRILMELTLVASITSCGFMARIFYLFSISYKSMGEVIKEVKEGSKKVEDINVVERMATANKIHSQIEFAEKLTLVLELVVAIVIIVVVTYFLFIAHGTPLPIHDGFYQAHQNTNIFGQSQRTYHVYTKGG